MALSLANLSELSRTLRHYVHAGLTLRHALQALSRKGPVALRDLCGRLSERLEQGESLEDALRPEGTLFPALFVDLTIVGEKSGMLPEVFAELEKFYVRQQKLRREFVAHISWPVIQFFLAVFVLTGMIFVLGLIAQSQGPGGKPFDPLGLGLSGGAGALTFLGFIFGSLGMFVATFFVARRVLGQGVLDEYLLRLPAIGPCLLALALARFCMALRLTMETAMPIRDALKLSLRATGNSAFIARTKEVQLAVRRGDDLTQVLQETRLFPELFMSSLAVGEESGQVPEVMRRLGEEYNDEAGRRLNALAAVAAYGVWIMVAVLMVVAIFRIALSYISLLG